MWHADEIKRCQELRERSKELREAAQKICAKSREIQLRSAGNQKAGENYYQSQESDTWKLGSE